MYIYSVTKIWDFRNISGNAPGTDHWCYINASSRKQICNEVSELMTVFFQNILLNINKMQKNEGAHYQPVLTKSPLPNIFCTLRNCGITTSQQSSSSSSETVPVSLAPNTSVVFPFFVEAMISSSLRCCTTKVSLSTQSKLPCSLPYKLVPSTPYAAFTSCLPWHHLSQYTFSSSLQ